MTPDPHGYRRLARALAAAALLALVVALTACIPIPTTSLQPTRPAPSAPTAEPIAEPIPAPVATPTAEPEPVDVEPDEAAYLAAIHAALPETRDGTLDDVLVQQGSMSCAYGPLDAWLDVVDPTREPMLTRLSAAIYESARPSLCGAS